MKRWYEEFYSDKFLDWVGFADADQTRHEAEFVQQALKLSSKSTLLDVCCGYGRHSREIANLTDWHVTGFDLSADYLARAHREFQHPNVTYVQGDMRDLPFEHQFDAVVNLFTSFGIFEADEENESILNQVHKVLKNKGLFLLDYENKFYFFQHDVLPKARSWHKIDDRHYALIENEYDLLREREIYTATLLEDGNVIAKSGYNIRLYGFPEIEAMLNRCGFQILNTWGDYEGQPLSVHSRRVIILSQKM